jgi:hypothetical protein
LLHTSVPTINTHIHRIYEKPHVRSRAQPVAKFTHLSALERFQKYCSRGAAFTPLRHGLANPR